MANITKGTCYSDSKFGLVRRAIFDTKADAATTGTLAESFLNFPTKVQIVGFGVMSAASDVVASTNASFDLETENGTKLASLVFDGTTTLASGNATVAAIETATTYAKNRALRFYVGTNTGTTGSVFGVVDYVEQFDAGV